MNNNKTMNRKKRNRKKMSNSIRRSMKINKKTKRITRKQKGGAWHDRLHEEGQRGQKYTHANVYFGNYKSPSKRRYFPKKAGHSSIRRRNYEQAVRDAEIADYNKNRRVPPPYSQSFPFAGTVERDRRKAQSMQEAHERIRMIRRGARRQAEESRTSRRGSNRKSSGLKNSTSKKPKWR